MQRFCITLNFLLVVEKERDRPADCIPSEGYSSVIYREELSYLSVYIILLKACKESYAAILPVGKVILITMRINCLEANVRYE